MCKADEDIFFAGDTDTEPDRLYDHLTAPKTLLRFTSQEGADAHCHVGAQRLAMSRIYDWLALKLTPAVEQSVREWQVTNRSGAHGTHRYTAEQFGLSEAQLRSEYDFYIRHFDVAVEG